MLPQPTRHALYAPWLARHGHGGARGAEAKELGPPHPAVALADADATQRARQALKRVANEKKNTKTVGRLLAKVWSCDVMPRNVT